MDIRRQELEEPFSVPPERMFEILITPSAIRSWWGAATAVVDARKGGSWITAWGEGERPSHFVSSFEILEFDPPSRLVLGAGKLMSESMWPIQTDMTTEFVVTPQPVGCTLRIVQQLAPHEPLLDDYFDACVAGWQNSYQGIRSYLHDNPD
jgi:uncharacterized protein YndB with AHSA1/START domain